MRLTDLRRSNPEDLIGLSIQQKQVELAQIAVERLDRGVDPLLQNDVQHANWNWTNSPPPSKTPRSAPPSTVNSSHCRLPWAARWRHLIQWLWWPILKNWRSAAI
ncbi:MAG: hypothetical protein R2856_02745 [Caldilineaceae bacterium]